LAKLERIKTDSLRAQVYGQLKRQLMDGVWKTGEKIPSENELCITFGVSRVTVRAAIQQLEILGLVETKHGGGTFVRDYSSMNAMTDLHSLMQISKNQDIIAVLEFRKIIEKGAIGLAVSRITDKDIDDLEGTYAALKTSANDPEAFAEADYAFHYRIAQIARNPIIAKVYDVIDEILSSAMVDIVRLLGSEMGLKYHRELIDALRSGDKQACEKLMEAHIEVTIQAILAADD
jgi:GntR family transcriptional repressor for pyruvate dehydrogenase complex